MYIGIRSIQKKKKKVYPICRLYIAPNAKIVVVLFRKKTSELTDFCRLFSVDFAVGVWMGGRWKLN
jgi:hypothetical protein